MRTQVGIVGGGPAGLTLALLERGVPVRFEAPAVELHALDSERPRIAYTHDGDRHELECDFVAGCDGFHGICRGAVPEGALTAHEYVYPFSWLGVLAQAPPSTDELIYTWHEHGFALHSMRSPRISRLYL